DRPRLHGPGFLGADPAAGESVGHGVETGKRRRWRRAMTARVQHLEGSEQQKSRAFSPAMITEGGKTVWLAGQTALVDEDGANIAGDCAAQARTIFTLMDKTLKRAGGSLANLVTMTV